MATRRLTSRIDHRRWLTQALRATVKSHAARSVSSARRGAFRASLRKVSWKRSSATSVRLHRRRRNPWMRPRYFA